LIVGNPVLPIVSNEKRMRSRREIHAAQEGLEARVAAQRVKLWVHIQLDR
jgi:hypothetical protein